MFNRLICYHGCHRSIAPILLKDKSIFLNSRSGADWLGTGVYFWVESYSRAMSWARDFHKNEAFVIGAVVDLKNCLNLTDHTFNSALRLAYADMVVEYDTAGIPIPQNESGKSGAVTKRRRDSALIDYVHAARLRNGFSAYDSVLGFFEGSNPLFPGTELKINTHIQVALRSPETLVELFVPYAQRGGLQI